MLPIWFGYIIGGGAIVLVIALCVLLVKYYQDRHDSEPIPTSVTVISLSLALCCVVLVPVDIFSVSSSTTLTSSSLLSSSYTYDPSTTSKLIKYLYFILYGVLALTIFLVVPFAYFYFEEYDEDITTKKRVLGALKYTAFLVVVVVILLVIGLFVKTGSAGDLSGNPSEWWNEIKNSTNLFESSIGFVVACMTLVGFVIFLTYTAFGLSRLPIGLIRGRRQVTEEVTDAQQNLELTRQKQRVINAKYASGVKITKKDEQQLSLLKQQERIYEQHTMRLSRETGSGVGKLVKWAKPLLILVGIVFLLFSLLLVISIVMTQIDKIINTNCGFKCGYILSLPSTNNPLDMLLVILADYFPLDSIVLGAVVTYIFFSTLSGICGIGIRFLWIELFKVRPHSTPPQGLLLSAVFLTLSVLAVCLELLTLAPRYVTFGTQTYFVNETIKLCDMQASTNECHMTQIAKFFYSVTGVNQSFLGIIFYYAGWLFVVAYLVGLVVAFFKRKDANVEVSQEEIDDDELDGAVPQVHTTSSSSKSRTERIASIRSSRNNNAAIV